MAKEQNTPCVMLEACGLADWKGQAAESFRSVGGEQIACESADLPSKRRVDVSSAVGSAEATEGTLRVHDESFPGSLGLPPSVVPARDAKREIDLACYVCNPVGSDGELSVQAVDINGVCTNDRRYGPRHRDVYFVPKGAGPSSRFVERQVMRDKQQTRVTAERDSLVGGIDSSLELNLGLVPTKAALLRRRDTQEVLPHRLLWDTIAEDAPLDVIEVPKEGCPLVRGTCDKDTHEVYVEGSMPLQRFLDCFGYVSFGEGDRLKMRDYTHKLRGISVSEALSRRAATGTQRDEKEEAARAADKKVGGGCVAEGEEVKCASAEPRRPQVAVLELQKKGMTDVAVRVRAAEGQEAKALTVEEYDSADKFLRLCGVNEMTTHILKKLPNGEAVRAFPPWKSGEYVLAVEWHVPYCVPHAGIQSLSLHLPSPCEAASDVVRVAEALLGVEPRRLCLVDSRCGRVFDDVEKVSAGMPLKLIPASNVIRVRVKWAIGKGAPQELSSLFDDEADVNQVLQVVCRAMGKDDSEEYVFTKALLFFNVCVSDGGARLCHLVSTACLPVGAHKTEKCGSCRGACR